MTKAITIDLNPNTFLVPALDLLALWNATSKEHTRYYLQGVFIEHTASPSGHTEINLVATDGHVMLHKAAPARAYLGESVATQSDEERRGFILSLDVAEKAFKAKPKGELWAYGDVETGIVQFVDIEHNVESLNGVVCTRLGVCEFTRIDHTFPDYRRILPAKGNEGSACLQFNPELLMKFQKAAKVFTKTVGLKLAASDPGDPIRIEFKGLPDLTGVLMPIRY